MLTNAHPRATIATTTLSASTSPEATFVNAQKDTQEAVSYVKVIASSTKKFRNFD